MDKSDLFEIRLNVNFNNILENAFTNWLWETIIYKDINTIKLVIATIKKIDKNFILTI